MPFRLRNLSSLCCTIVILATWFGLPPKSAALETPQKKCSNPSFKLAIDVGHTPQAPGATSARGISEYTFNLRLADRVVDAARAAGYKDVSLITENGFGRSQLLMRANEANALKPDLLISIHHDAVQRIYQEEWTYDGHRRPYSDRFSGYSIFASRLNKSASQSFGFAKLLGEELMLQGFKYSAHHAEAIPGEGRELIDRKLGVYAYDDLVVLEYSLVPAVLLEAGIIVNRADELLLSSPRVQQQMSTAILKAVDSYCSTSSLLR